MKKQIVISDDVFRKILGRYELGDFVSSQKLSSGFANPAYIINEKYVIRFHEPVESSGDRFSRESILYSILEQKSIPAPKLIAMDLTQVLIPYHYIIISLLPGKDLTTAWQTLAEKDKDELAFETGKFLRQIHSIRPEDIGTNLQLFKASENWKKYFLEVFERDYGEFNNHGNELVDNLRADIEKTVEEFRQLGDEDFSIGLLHYDFHADHVMTDGKQVTGLFDFEWARFGDPLWDMQKLPIGLDVDGEFSSSDFLRGYGTPKFTDKELIRFKSYCYLQGIWQIDNTRNGNFGFPKSQIEKGYELVRQTLNWGV